MWFEVIFVRCLSHPEQLMNWSSNNIKNGSKSSCYCYPHSVKVVQVASA